MVSSLNIQLQFRHAATAQPIQPRIGFKHFTFSIVSRTGVPQKLSPEILSHHQQLIMDLSLRSTNTITS